MIDLNGKIILVASGPTTAPIDDVRFITNKSSGRLGSVIAYTLLLHGAKVEQLYGQGSLTARSLYTDKNLEELVTTSFETVDELKHALKSRLQSQNIDAVIMAVAVLDYIPDRVEGKQPSSEETWTVTFRRGEKLIEQIQHCSPDTLIVGFKLESRVSLEELKKRAEDLMMRSKAKIVIANRLEEVNEQSHTAYMIVTEETGVTILEPLSSREEIAGRLVDQLAKMWSLKKEQDHET